MLVWGMVISWIWGARVPSALWEIAPFFKSLALIVILLRAGLGINRKTLNKTGTTSILMGFIPCLAEAGGLTLMFHFILGFSYQISALAAFILSAASMAVVVPSMLNFQARGHGAKKQVPAIILAGTSLDNALAFSLFALALNLIVSPGASPVLDLLSIPYALIGGVLLGGAVGFLMVYAFHRYYGKIRATEKLVIALTCSFLLLELGNKLHLAALLGMMVIGLIIFEKDNQTAHELAAKLSKWWIIAEIILFVLIGMSVKPASILNTGWKGLLIISLGLLFRSAGVVLATAFSRLNRKEKLFCVLAYIPKATVQAALGAVPLTLGIAHGEEILSISVLSILFTAPLGLFLVNHSVKKLLHIELTT